MTTEFQPNELRNEKENRKADEPEFFPHTEHVVAKGRRPWSPADKKPHADMKLERPVFLDTGPLLDLQRRLAEHPVYQHIADLPSLRWFMSNHVYSVWDFMSLLKSLQAHIAPATVPWAPVDDSTLRRFINDIVLGEESDLGMPVPDGPETYVSHFELYCRAMAEVGNDPAPAQSFAAAATKMGVQQALTMHQLPRPARDFMKSTFKFIETSKPHVIAAAFTLGREHIIPEMFRALIRKMKITAYQAPAFHYYLERHIQLDGDHHGPLSELMLAHLCAGDDQRLEEAEKAALDAMQARLTFWDGVLRGIKG